MSRPIVKNTYYVFSREAERSAMKGKKDDRSKAGGPDRKRGRADVGTSFVLKIDHRVIAIIFSFSQQ